MNPNSKLGGIIRVDAREKRVDEHGMPTAIQAIADEQAFLKVLNPNDPSHPWSYDLEVVTKCGQVIKIEAKWSHNDCISTWTDREADGHSRLTRQVSYVDLLLIVWDEFKLELERPTDPVEAKKWQATIKGVRNRLARMNIESDPPVERFASLADAISFLDYLKRRTEPISFAKRFKKEGAPPAEAEEDGKAQVTAGGAQFSI